MSASDKLFTFESVLRESTIAAVFHRLSASKTRARHSKPVSRSSGFAAIAVFAGFAIASAIVFVTGYSALLSDTPGIWIHRLMALAVAQSMLIALVAMKLLPLGERRQNFLRLGPNSKARISFNEEQEHMARSEPPPLPKPVQRTPVSGGTLAGREFMEFDDGTIEIDTLVGRRRFISIDAAREFVGG